MDTFLAVLGTLGGVCIGAFVTWKIQERQIAHENETRFHERRLDIYAEYLETSSRAIAEFKLAGAMSDNNFSRCANSLQRVRLVASQPVFKVVDECRSMLAEVATAQIKDPKNREALSQSFNKKTAQLVKLMRKEINVR